METMPGLAANRRPMPDLPEEVMKHSCLATHRIALITMAFSVLACPVVAQQFESHKIVATQAADDEFGADVALDDNLALVGGRYDKNGSIATGLVHVYTPDGPNWIAAQQIVSSDAIAWDRFGGAVAVSGYWLIAGAFGDDDNGNWSGSAYLFRDDGATWTDQIKIKASDAAADDQFGWAVAIDGDTAVVGAVGNDDGGSRSGSAYVFVRDGAAWTQQAKLIATDDAAGDEFGTSVAIDGDVVAIGAPLKSSSTGKAYVFERSGTLWTQTAILTASTPAAGNLFGAAVAVADDDVIVGAPGENTATGAVHLFERTGSTWTHQTSFTPADAAEGDNFGAAVAMIAGQFVAGAPGHDDGRGRRLPL